jgi:hypothetical protein
MSAVEWDIEEDQVITNNNITIEDCLLAGSAGVMIPNETYHALPGISGSNLSLLAESNKHLDNKHLFNLGDLPSLVMGTLVHALVLEPELVDDEFAIIPKFGAKSETGISITDAEKEFYRDNADKKIIDLGSFNRAVRMARNVRAICGDVIDAGIKERSLFANVDGLVLKCRLDIDLESEGDDYDLKTITLGIKEFSDATLEQHIKKLKYHWSAALRNIIRRHLGKPVRHSYLIFVNTGPGHMVRVIKISPVWIKESEAVVKDMLADRRLYIESHKTFDRPIIAIDDRFRKVEQY